MKHIRSIMCAATLLALPAVPAAWAGEAAEAAPSTVPAEAFFDFEVMYAPVLSPDGSAIALLVRNKAGRRQLAVLDTADVRRATIVAAFQDYDVGHVRWVNDKRLVLSLFDETEAAIAYESKGTGLYAVDRDGANFRLLIKLDADMVQQATMINHRELSPIEFAFDRTLSDGSDDIVVGRFVNTDTIRGQYRWYERIGVVPMRLNTRTGELRELARGRTPDRTWDWAIDAQGHVLAAMSKSQGEEALHVPEGGDWKERARFPAYGTGKGYSLLEEAGADGTVYAEHSNAAGASALYRLNLATGRTETEPVLSAKGFDVSPELIQDLKARKLLGIRYMADAGGTAWFDPAMKAMQAKVDARLPGLVNAITPASCGCAARVLVVSTSDRQPALFHLYEPATDTLQPIGIARPAILRRQMADTDFVRIQARDGNDLPIYVTKPHGKGPWPTVVLVHGGPFVRGWDWDWDGESQFLASRGYLVVKPEFRGSKGYGSKLYLSGLRQWGLAMQDDIADATTWAAKEGLADPARTCIAGASYGGYATLMGLARYPQLYRCGIAWAAVTDINLMYDISWSDMGSDYRAFGMPMLIGDQVKDAAQLAATSPLEQAAKITRPLLLAHGGVDHRVPIKHATKMRDALEAHHAPVTWLEYRDEGHGWYKPENRADFYRRMEAFLAANIGPGTPKEPALTAQSTAASAASR
jgi:dienelactone hydrolase